MQQKCCMYGWLAVCWVCWCNQRVAWSEGQMRHGEEAGAMRGDRSDQV